MKIPFEMCTIKGCGKKNFARGLCRKHYQQVKKYGEVRDRGKVVDLDSEKWCNIVDAEGFHVSNMGRVKSEFGLIKPRIEKRANHYTPRQRVYLDRRRTKGWVKFLYVHKEVCWAFNGPSSGKVYFKDGDTMNCKADNLEWFKVDPPVCLEGLWSFRNSVHTDTGKSVLAFIEGDRAALNGYLLKQTDILQRKLTRRYGLLGKDIIKEATQLALVEGVANIKRGLLREDANIDGWFSTIARVKVLNLLRDGKKEISEWVSADGREVSRFTLGLGAI